MVRSRIHGLFAAYPNACGFHMMFSHVSPVHWITVENRKTAFRSRLKLCDAIVAQFGCGLNANLMFSQLRGCLSLGPFDKLQRRYAPVF